MTSPRRRHPRLVAGAAILATLAASTAVGLVGRGAPPAEPVPPRPPTAEAAAAPAPSLRFEPNRGQTDARFAFVGRGSVDLSLSAADVVFAVGAPSGAPTPGAAGQPAGAVVGMRLVGGRADAAMDGLDPLAGRTNYITGAGAGEWLRGVPTFGRVRAQEVYPGIDVIYRPAAAGFEYDFIVAAGADPRPIAVAFEGTAGLSLDASGDLLIHTAAATVRQRRPVAFQDIDGTRRMVAADYRLDGVEVRVRLGPYDATRPLVVDPEIAYASYLGPRPPIGTPSYVAPGPGGSAYVAATSGAGFPTRPGTVLQPDPMGGASRGVVARFNRDGQLGWATYLGPAQSALGLAIDAQGNAYVSGSARDGFPTTASRARGCAAYDVYLAKLDSRGENLLYSTCVGFGSGGNDFDEKNIVLDGSGRAYVTSYTTDPNFPIKNAYRATKPGVVGAQAVTLSLVDTTLSGDASLVFSTWVGQGLVAGMTATADGVVLTGTATNGPGNSLPDFPSAAANAEMGAGACALDQLWGGRGFLARFRVAGPGPPQLAWTACLGSATPKDVAVDPATQHVYVVGQVLAGHNTLATTANAYRARAEVDSKESFLAQFDLAAGGTSSLRYLTQLGGNGQDPGGVADSMGVTVGADGHVFVSAGSTSTDLPVRNPLVPAGPGGAGDLWVAELDTTKSGDASLVSSSVFGGSKGESVDASALDPITGDLLISGYTLSGDFPVTPDAAQATTESGSRLFVRISPSPTIDSVAPTQGPACGGNAVVITGTRLGNTTASFGSTPAPGRALSDTSFAVVAPAHAPGPVEVALTTPKGSRATAAYTYTPVATPVVSAVSPDRGSTGGGTVVTISGTSLGCARALSIGGAVATDLKVVSDTQLTGTTPAHAAGTVDVTVSVDTGAGSTTSAPAAGARFTYIARPVISAISPACGPLAGETTVTLTGTGLIGVAGVRFGDTDAALVPTPAPTDTSVQVRSPAVGAATAATVALTNPGGTSAASPAAVFSYPCTGGTGLDTSPDPGAGGGADGAADTPPPAPPSGGTGTSPQGGFANNPAGGGADGPGLSTSPPPTPSATVTGGLSTPPPVQAAAPSAPPVQAAAPSAPPVQAAAPSAPPVQAPVPLPAPAPPASSPTPGPAGSPAAPDQGPAPAPRHTMVRQEGGLDAGAAALGGTLVLVVLTCSVVIAGGLAQQARRARPRESTGWCI